MNLASRARAYLQNGRIAEVSFLHLFRSAADGSVPMPSSSAFYLYFVLAGELRLYTPGGILDYIAGQYAVSAIDTPERGYILALSQQQDFLAAAVDFTANDVISVLLALDDALMTQIMEDRLDAAFKETQDACVLSCLERMLDALREPLSMQFLCEQIRTEMLFHVLCGSCGKAFVQSITRLRSAREIYEVNSWIKQNYRQSFKVEELAGQWNMSVSQFHRKFKSAVGMGPLQCQKRLRLTEARRLMLDEGKNATETALDVGYESLSQFIRDYRKMFGSAPGEDVARLRLTEEK